MRTVTKNESEPPTKLMIARTKELKEAKQKSKISSMKYYAKKGVENE